MPLSNVGNFNWQNVGKAVKRKRNTRSKPITSARRDENSPPAFADEITSSVSVRHHTCMETIVTPSVYDFIGDSQSASSSGYSAVIPVVDFSNLELNKPTTGAFHVINEVHEQDCVIEPVADEHEHIGTDEMDQVNVLSLEAGQRSYDKRYYCLFCDKAYAKIKSHLVHQHGQSSEVAEMLSKSSKQEMNTHLIRLRNLGNHKHNCDVLRVGIGSIVVVYRPRYGSNAKADNYIPCPHCFGYYEKHQLWRHCKKRCVLKPLECDEKRVIAHGYLLLPVPEHMCKNTTEVLSHIRRDEVYRAIMSDPLIMQLAHKLTVKHYSDADRHEHIRCKVRECGRLLVKLREDHQIQSVADALDPINFKLLLSSVRKLAGYCDQTQTYTTPSLALKLGHSLKKCAVFQISEALQISSKEQEQKAEAFIRLCEIEWSDEVSTSALKTLHHKKLNKVTILPLTSDISKMTNHLTMITSRSMDVLASNSSTKDSCSAAWRSLTEATLAQLIMFNRRRVGEVSKMNLGNFQAGLTANRNNDITEHLSELEIKLSGLLTRVELVGKSDNHVPCLLTSTFKKALDVIIEKREEVGVLDSNLFVFALPRSDHHIRGSDVMYKYASECGAEAPDTLRGTTLRKHIGTISQVLNLKENELELLAQFMGHNIKVHREFYRLPSDILQTAKVAKLLMAMDSGQHQQLTGQCLDDIQLDLDEGIEGEYSVTAYFKLFEMCAKLLITPRFCCNLCFISNQIGAIAQD
jgi:hypothetical protein